MLEWSYSYIFFMKQTPTQQRTHSITKKMSIIGLIIGLSALSIWALSSQSLPSYAAPLWLQSIIGTYNPSHTLGVFNTSGGGGNAGQLTFISESDETLLG